MGPFSFAILVIYCTLFNNMLTLKFKGQPTNAFFPAVNQIFGRSSQLTTTAEHCFAVWTGHNNLITTCSAVVKSWEKPPNMWTLNFRIRMLLKGALVKVILNMAKITQNAVTELLINSVSAYFSLLFLSSSFFTPYISSISNCRR